MRRSSRAAVASLLVIAFAGPVRAATYSPDPLTVSGRFEAPRAVDGPLKARMTVREASISDADAAFLGGRKEKLQPALESALAASLRNFGYLAPKEAVDIVALSIKLDTLDITPSKDAVAVVARLQISATGPDARCVPLSAEARFRALAPMKAVGEGRVAAWVVVVGLAAVGLNATQFGATQLATASASDAAANARRTRTEFESVSPEGGEKAMTRYAAINATQLAAADLIRQLGKSACPAAPDAPSPSPSPSPAKAVQIGAASPPPTVR